MWRKRLRATPQTVCLLVLENGKCPIEEWLLHDIRDISTRARIVRQLDKLQRGIFGDWKGTSGNTVQELRLDIGPGYRVYYGRLGQTVVVLIEGGDKGSQKSDIRRAQGLWERFIATGAPEEQLKPWQDED